MSKKYWIVAIIIILIATVIKVATMDKPSTTQQNTEKIKIVATFYPLAYFSEQVGGEYVAVTNITPPGAEPHDFEPTPRDIAAIYGADLFVTNGQGVDAWADKIIPELKAKGITVITMSDHLAMIKNTGQPGHKEEAEEPEEHGEYDPHFWLDVSYAGKEAEIIKEALIQIDSTHAQEYNKNKDAFAQKLVELDKQYRAGLSNCQSREIITAHDAFGYLAQRYNLSAFHILGLSPEEEPSPKTIAEITEIAKEKQIKYIFFETIVDQRLSNTIAQEIGAQTLVLNPLESLTKEEIADNKDYISIMKENLYNLQTALVCQPAQ